MAMGTKSSDSNYSGSAQTTVPPGGKPGIFTSMLHFLVLLFLLLFVVGGMIFKGDWAPLGLPPFSVDCCAGLHVAIGFFCWWFPPLGILSIGYQIADSQGMNEAVSGHGAEPIEATIGDCLEYVIGFSVCYLSHTTLPLHTLDPQTFVNRLKKTVWPRWGRVEGEETVSVQKSIFHVALVILCTSYFFVGLHWIPQTEDEVEILSKYRQYTRCCSNIHVALGPPCWYNPPLLVAFLWYQLAEPSRWNSEGTLYGGIVAEYLIGICMAITAHRVKPLWSLKPNVICKRVANLFWARWGNEEDANVVAGSGMRQVSGNSSRDSRDVV
ncbi:hypothetical protein TrVE_jg4906 [Triparma verrucosa]|uniref:Uncharacterized protein n=1 Tax=Triparma verrucosa TaxID=1606542 RepID=A0A9W7BVI5_9STRA|nr:hypothetical protein TrVE_jg4906 [Triparma verrucosa]